MTNSTCSLSRQRNHEPIFSRLELLCAAAAFGEQPRRTTRVVTHLTLPDGCNSATCRWQQQPNDRKPRKSPATSGLTNRLPNGFGHGKSEKFPGRFTTPQSRSMGLISAEYPSYGSFSLSQVLGWWGLPTFVRSRRLLALCRGTVLLGHREDVCALEAALGVDLDVVRTGACCGELQPRVISRAAV